MDSLSQRGREACKPALSYLDAFFRALTNPYNAESNPDGFLCLTVAENSLTFGPIREKLESIGPVFPPHVESYQDMRGTPRTRAAMAAFLADHIFRRPVDAEHVVLSAGCGSLVEHLVFALCDKGDAILLPAPYYPGFDNDTRTRFGGVPVPVPLVVQDDGSYRLLPDVLESTYHSSVAAGHTPRILLLTNPHNPLGTIYAADELLAAVEWGRSHSIHVVVDEIYALSVYQTGEEAPADRQSYYRKFVSIGELIPKGEFGDYLHTLYGFSKDFCMSGFRVGVLHTENETLLQLLGNVGYFTSVSNYTQETLARLIEDREFMDEYFAENRRRLSASWAILSAGLTELGIDFLEPQAGIFVWVDMRKFLKEQTPAGERALWTILFDKLHLLLTPGEDCHSSKPGFFRLCFAFVSTPAMHVLVSRLRELKDHL